MLTHVYNSHVFCYRETLTHETDNWHSYSHLGNINQGIILIESSPLP